MANRWRNIAAKRLFWADAITPEVSQPQPASKSSNRKSDPDVLREASSWLKDDLKTKWPHIPRAERIVLFAKEIGWSTTRAKDVYYADHRVSLRAFEQDELTAWLNQQKETKA